MDAIKPISRVGYFLVGRSEITLINERLGGSSTSAKAVWLALIQLSSERKDPPDFDVEVALITHLAGDDLIERYVSKYPELQTTAEAIVRRIRNFCTTVDFDHLKQDDKPDPPRNS